MRRPESPCSPRSCYPRSDPLGAPPPTTTPTHTHTRPLCRSRVPSARPPAHLRAAPPMSGARSPARALAVVGGGGSQVSPARLKRPAAWPLCLLAPFPYMRLQSAGPPYAVPLCARLPAASRARVPFCGRRSPGPDPWAGSGARRQPHQAGRARRLGPTPARTAPLAAAPPATGHAYPVPTPRPWPRSTTTVAVTSPSLRRRQRRHGDHSKRPGAPARWTVAALLVAAAAALRSRPLPR